MKFSEMSNCILLLLVLLICSLQLGDALKCSDDQTKCNNNKQCIAKTEWCDGVAHCKDGSDEAPIECFGLLLNETCPNQFDVKCRSLECIPQEDACDGKKDCADGSDETKPTCKPQSCQRHVFRCAYGACIAKKLRCDDRNDCVDGSDEINCRASEPQLGTRVDSEDDLSAMGCVVPDDGNLIVIDNFSKKQLTAGTQAQLATYVDYVCPRGHTLVGEYSTNACFISWLNPHPKCIKMCYPIVPHVSRNAHCFNRNNEAVSCSSQVYPGTTAKIICAEGYKMPNHKVHSDLLCQADGDWDYSLFKCDQTCGTVDNSRQFSVNGKVTEAQFVPWNVAIYQMDDSTNQYQHICGGTLIYSRLAVSAAHCFWNTSNNSRIDPGEYRVAVGKFYRDYYATNEKQVIQTSALSDIRIPLVFSGAQYDYISDVAVLILSTDIIFKNYIKPACLDWKSLNEKSIPTHKYGLVAGWGITETGSYSTELRTVELMSIDFETCRQRITRGNQISSDKFCVETGEKKNVCEGDSGGGFVMPETINGSTYYQLWGVVSNGVFAHRRREKVCNEEFITAFTNVQWYEDLIKKSKDLAYPV